MPLRLGEGERHTYNTMQNEMCGLSQPSTSTSTGSPKRAVAAERRGRNEWGAHSASSRAKSALGHVAPRGVISRRIAHRWLQAGDNTYAWEPVLPTD